MADNAESLATGNGRGAWSTLGKDNGSRYYTFIKDTPLDGSIPVRGPDEEPLSTEEARHYIAVNYGVKAIQKRVDALGFRGRFGGRLVQDGLYGNKTRKAVKWFQEREGLAGDGTVGPTTAGLLWVEKVRWVGETVGGGRPELLWGMTQLESGFDPGAVSFKFKVENGPDFGMCQINLHFNPKVSLDQAFDPAFALKWSARRLSDALRRFSGKGPELQEQCAVAYHNSPVRAQQWYDTGQPPTEQIEEYVRLVLERAETFPEL